MFSAGMSLSFVGTLDDESRVREGNPSTRSRWASALLASPADPSGCLLRRYGSQGIRRFLRLRFPGLHPRSRIGRTTVKAVFDKVQTA